MRGALGTAGLGVLRLGDEGHLTVEKDPGSRFEAVGTPTPTIFLGCQ